MSAVLARATCARRFRPAGSSEPAKPCGHTALWSGLLTCTTHEATFALNLCARCSVMIDTRGSKCGTCKERTVVLVALLRLDGADA